MDLYTRTAMTSTRHDDLLREAGNARLAATGDGNGTGEATRRPNAMRLPALRLRDRLAGLAVHRTKPVGTAHQHG